MNDEKHPVNPHTGQPLPPDDAAATPSPGAGAAFEADRGPRPEDPATGHLSPPPPRPTAAAGEGSSAPATLSPQEIAIRAACETVMDPEIGLSVIDLGLIREVHFLEVNVSPGLTETSMFPMAVEAAGYDLGDVLASLLALRAGR